MPRGNGTGPMGMGPMSGRGAGYCAGLETSGYANRGLGCGGGFGGGRGRRNQFQATGLTGRQRTEMVSSAVDTEVILRNQAEVLQRRLDVVRGKLAEMTKAK